MSELTHDFTETRQHMQAARDAAEETLEMLRNVNLPDTRAKPEVGNDITTIQRSVNALSDALGRAHAAAMAAAENSAGK